VFGCVSACLFVRVALRVCERGFKSACVSVCLCVRVVCVCVCERERERMGGREEGRDGGR